MLPHHHGRPLPPLKISVGVRVAAAPGQADSAMRVNRFPTTFGDAFIVAHQGALDGLVARLQSPSGGSLPETLKLMGIAPPAAVIAFLKENRATIVRGGAGRACLLRGHRLNILTPENPSILEVDLQPGDGLLLCSDGLWRRTSHADLEAIGLSPLSTGAVAEALVNLAIQEGSHEGIALQFLRFTARPVPPPPAPKTWWGLRPAVLGALLLLATALIASGVCMAIWNSNRPLKPVPTRESGPLPPL